MNKIWLKAGIFVLLGCLFLKYFESVAFFAKSMVSVISPLLLGCVIAYILNIVLRFLEGHYGKLEQNRWLGKLKRPLCILTSFGIIALILVAVLCLVVPEVVSSGQVLAKAIPEAVNQSVDWINANFGDIPAIEELLGDFEVDWPKVFENIMSVATSGIGSIFNSAVSIVGIVAGGVMNLVIGLIFAIYLLANKEKLYEQLGKVARAYLPGRVRSVSGEFLLLADDTFSRFIVGQCMEAVILGSLCALGMLLLRLPYAAMTGVIVGLTALIPVVGAYLGAALGAFMILMVNPMQALIFLVFLVILQQVEGNLIYPKVVGSSVGLPGIWVLAAVTAGGGLWGVLGMLLGVPLAATLYKWMGRCTNLRLRKMEEESREETGAQALAGSGAKERGNAGI